jgi:hypothetical protein
MKKFLFAAFGIFVSSAAFAQSPEHTLPLRLNPVQSAEVYMNSMQRSAVFFPTDTIVLGNTGIHENFAYDSHRPDTLLWELDPVIQPQATGVYINRTWPIAPINLGVCTFDGLKYNGEPYNEMASVNSTGPCDELISRPIDLTAYTVADSVYLTFWYQAQGRGYAPNAADSFILDFNIPAWNPDQFTHTWKRVWYMEGYNPSSADTNFHLVMIRLDSASYFTSGFRMRFRNYASQCGSNDHWHLDELLLKSNRTMNDTIPLDVAFAYEPNSALKDYWAVPYPHYKPNVHMGTNYNVQIRNNDLVNRNITYWYYMETGAGTFIYPNAAGAANPGGTPPYWTSGYENYAAISNPPITASFDQTYVNTDSTTLKVQHVLKSSATQFDTVTSYQKFYNYYAYDDGTAEVGYGLSGANALLAYQFTLPTGVTDQLTAVQMYFLPVLDINNLQLRDWTLTIWGDAGGQPGTIIYQQRTQHIGFDFSYGPDRFITYTIDSGTVMLSGTFYVGWQQLGPDRLYVGLDLNTNNEDKIFYNTTGNWYTSIFGGSLMMRPVFGDPYNVSGTEEHAAGEKFSLYPNPAKDRVTIALPAGHEKYNVRMLDISGREVMATQQLSADGGVDVSSLSAGVYLVQLFTEDGELQGTQRLIISE